jgi:hypothetical protein
MGTTITASVSLEEAGASSPEVAPVSRHPAESGNFVRAELSAIK